MHLIGCAGFAYAVLRSYIYVDWASYVGQKFAVDVLAQVLHNSSGDSLPKIQKSQKCWEPKPRWFGLFSMEAL